MTDANPSQLELNHLRQRVIDLAAWQDEVKRRFAEWKSHPVMNCEKTKAERELERAINDDAR